MILVLSNGQQKTIRGDETVIVPLPGREFSIDNAATWESDRAWAFATVGRRIWVGGNETATIVEIKP